MWAVAFVSSAATVILRCGSSTGSFSVTPGVNKLKIPLSPGGMSVEMIRDGKTIATETASNYTYVTSIATCASSFLCYSNGGWISYLNPKTYVCFKIRQLQRLRWSRE